MHCECVGSPRISTETKLTVDHFLSFEIHETSKKSHREEKEIVALAHQLNMHPSDFGLCISVHTSHSPFKFKRLPSWAKHVKRTASTTVQWTNHYLQNAQQVLRVVVIYSYSMHNNLIRFFHSQSRLFFFFSSLRMQFMRAKQKIEIKTSIVKCNYMHGATEAVAFRTT